MPSEPLFSFKRSKRGTSLRPVTLNVARPQSIHGLDVPIELWIHITRFLSDEELYKLIGVNSVFLDLGMRCKWEEVVIDFKKVPDTLHLLERLRDPFVACKVKQLFLTLPQIKKPMVAEDTGLRKRLAQRLGLNKQSYKPTVEDAVKSFITVLPHLTSVHELHIDLWGFPAELCLSLIQSICNHFQKTLRILCLAGDTDSYRLLMEDCHLGFDTLTEVHFELASSASRVQASEADSKILRDVVAPFIGRHAQSLEVFRSWCWAEVDVSDFYTYLAQVDFQKLATIRIGTAFNKLTRDPAALKDFIKRNSKTLTRLELRLKPDRAQLDPSVETPLGEWLNDFVDEGIHFPQLQTLEIYPTNTDNGYKALLVLIQHTDATLRDLVIRDRYFTPPQAKKVIDATAQTRLRFLRMGAEQLDLELFNLIASAQPELHRLWLSVSATVGDEKDSFRQQLHRKTYPHWQLKDVHLWQAGQEMEVETLLEISRAVPSVDSFFGAGNEILRTRQLKAIVGSDLVEW